MLNVSTTRIVEPVRRAGTPVYGYEPGARGPKESG